MANVAILNYCNLKCPYCFADDMIKEKSTSISIEDYRKTLEYLARTPENHVGIIGGEPTLHPYFDQILQETNKYCVELNTGATLFTNGIELDKYMPKIGDRIGILVNCNSPKTVSEDLYSKMMDTLEHCYMMSWFDHRVNIGCNIYPGLDDYSYIWGIIDKYHINHLRTSVVSPGGCYQSMRDNKLKYYMTMKPIYVKFCEDAIKHHCKLNMDCGHIPSCYFSMEEKEIIREATDRYEPFQFCEPVIDIYNYKAIPCFGQFCEGVDIRDFENIIEVRRYLTAKYTLPHVDRNHYGKCATCKKAELLQCSGGCLSFRKEE